MGPTPVCTAELREEKVGQVLRQHPQEGLSLRR